MKDSLQHTCGIYLTHSIVIHKKSPELLLKLIELSKFEKTESDTVRILQLQNWSDITFYSNPDLHLKLQTDIVNL